MTQSPDQIACCESIARAVVLRLPKGWRQANVIAKLDEESVDLESSYINAAGVHTEMLSGYEVAQLFQQLSLVVTSQSKGIFKVARLTITAPSSYKFTYEY